MNLPFRAKRFFSSTRLGAGLAVCLAAVLAYSAVSSPPQFPDPGHAPMSRPQQEKLGLQAAAQVYQQMPVLPDSSPETQYIQALGNRLVAVIPKDRTWPYQFHVVAQKEVNAFALPGGPMFVNIGTITTVDNEAELAGVMAHEMGHVYMQHGAKQARKSEIAGIIGAIAGAVGGSALGTGVQLGAGALLLKYSRTDESQADAFGAVVLWHAHFNPMALADFFRKLQSSSNNGPQFLSDHPNPGNRDQAIQNQVRNWPPENYTPDSPQFAEARKHAGTVRAYTAQEIANGAKTGRWKAENARSGAVFPGAAAEGNAAPVTIPSVPFSAVQPSSNFQSANAGQATIDHPDNWQVTSSQQGSVTIAPRAGASGGAVAYGVVIEPVTLSGSDNNPQQVASEIAQSLQSGDGNMRQNGNVQTVTVSGTQAGSLQLTTISPMPGPDGKPQPERDWLIAVPRGNGKALAFVFVAPESNFDQLKPTFDRMLSSVRF